MVMSYRMRPDLRWKFYKLAGMCVCMLLFGYICAVVCAVVCVCGLCVWSVYVVCGCAYVYSRMCTVVCAMCARIYVYVCKVNVSSCRTRPFFGGVWCAQLELNRCKHGTTTLESSLAVSLKVKVIKAFDLVILLLGIYPRENKIHVHTKTRTQISSFICSGEKLLTIQKSIQFSSVAQSCPTLCDPIDCSTPGLPVHRQLLEFTQIHVH